jgi:hypothetical protein
LIPFELRSVKTIDVAFNREDFMDWLLTIELEESVVEKIDRTAKRLGKTRIEVANVIVDHILENLLAEKQNAEYDMKMNRFDAIKKDISH